jgi:hypothetical protein
MSQCEEHGRCSAAFGVPFDGRTLVAEIRLATAARLRQLVEAHESARIDPITGRFEISGCTEDAVVLSVPLTRAQLDGLSSVY